MSKDKPLYAFLQTAGEERAYADHSDCIHFFKNDTWAHFRGVMSNPSRWLRSHVLPIRRDRVVKELDLMVIPIDSGFTVDYAENARLVTLGVGPFRHRLSTVVKVADIIQQNQAESGVSTEIYEIRVEKPKIVSIHFELGDWKIWPRIAPLVLQNCNALMAEMYKRAAAGHGSLTTVDGDLKPHIVPPLQFRADARNYFYAQLSGNRGCACIHLCLGVDGGPGSGAAKDYVCV